MIFRTKEQWDRFVAQNNSRPNFQIDRYTQPERYPCYAKRVCTIYHPNHADEEMYEFFYVEEAQELLK